MKDEELKNWDVTFVSYRSEITKAKTKEEAWKIAESYQEPGERISTIDEVGVEREHKYRC